ncbi:Thymidine kinase, cytosolic [Aphelenchoides fujianensis]|nr:Thymidine kinase, cytosolic [Aphelenchoides fujianensis]KAI6238944.1 Thymidine kinase, cytosolic [Aphelenchoides fujianensis]
MDCQCNSRGSIHLIVGPMFSGKTTELLRQCRRHTLAKRKVAVVKYAKDTRYDDRMLSTHDGLKMEGLRAMKLADVWGELRESDVVGIDEGQFFEDVVERTERLADEGKTVIVASLDGDFRRKPFESIAQLVPLAETVEKRAAVCQFCGHSASFTLRTIVSDVREVIGGAEAYKAACRDCFRLKEEVDRQEQKKPAALPPFRSKTPELPHGERHVSAIKNIDENRGAEDESRVS